MNEITTLSGTGVPLLLDDIDTDRIIPARYLRCVTFDGLGEHAFKDDRQQDPEHPFDHEHHRNGEILVSGRNFGCGSSREHAPQSLMRWGIKAVVAESFAEIFFGNCTSLGIPCVTAARADLEKLSRLIKEDPHATLEVDLEAKQVRSGDLTVDVEMPESARQALVSGQYDFLGQLLEAEPQIRETTGQLPYVSQFSA